jgi:hypothetical protein
MILFDNICKVKFEIGDANRPGDSLTTFKAGVWVYPKFWIRLFGFFIFQNFSI